LPDDPGQDRRHEVQARRSAAADAARGVAEGPGQAVLGRGRDRQADRLRGGNVDHPPGGADPRRHGLFEGDAAGAVLPRRQDHRNLRGHLGDPAPGHRPQRDRPALIRRRWSDVQGAGTGPFAFVQGRRLPRGRWIASNGGCAGREHGMRRDTDTTRASRRRRAWTWLRLGLAAVLVLLLVLDLAFPPPLPGADGTATVVTAADGTPLRAFADRDGIWRYPATVESVSPLYLDALLTYEDRWFRRHPGINPVAMARAGWQWLRSGRIVSGGSTLSMQVARILDGHDTRSGPGKLRQMARAVQLEMRLSKDQI